LKLLSQELGGRIRMIVSGGAPLSQDVFDFLKKSFDCPVFECMGATEAAGNLTTTAALET